MVLVNNLVTLIRRHRLSSVLYAIVVQLPLFGIFRLMRCLIIQNDHSPHV